MVFAFLFCMASTVFAGVNGDFREKAEALRWIAYAPTNYDPDNGIYPSPESITADLKTLNDYGFNGIVTYGSYKSLADIPKIARETGFTGVIMGIWDINSREEIINAVVAASYVDGYCMGNEGLNSRYSMETLKKEMDGLKNLTDKPVTTTEQISDYCNNEVYDAGDWIFPNIHPFLCEVKEPKKAVKWIEKHYEILKKHCPQEKVILFKETGFPTRGMHGASQNNQMEFFANLEKTQVPFVYFEAFDQPWKNSVSCEPYWGLFSEKRKPKKFISSKKFK